MPFVTSTQVAQLAAGLAEGLPAEACRERHAALRRRLARDREGLLVTKYFLLNELNLSLEGELFANLSLAACLSSLDNLDRIEKMPALARTHESLASAFMAKGREQIALDEARHAMAQTPLNHKLKDRIRALDSGNGAFNRLTRNFTFSFQGVESNLPGDLPYEIYQFGDWLVLADLHAMRLHRRPVGGGSWEPVRQRFKYPFGHHIDDQGNLWVCDVWGFRLVCLDRFFNKAREIKMHDILRGYFDNPWPSQVCRFGERLFVAVHNIKRWRFSFLSFDLRDPTGTVKLYDENEFDFVYRIFLQKNFIYIVRLNQKDFSQIPGNVVARYKIEADYSLSFKEKFIFDAPVTQIIALNDGFFVTTFSSIIRTDLKMNPLFSIQLPFEDGDISLSNVGFFCAPEGQESSYILFLDHFYKHIARLGIK